MTLALGILKEHEADIYGLGQQGMVIALVKRIVDAALERAAQEADKRLSEAQQSASNGGLEEWEEERLLGQTESSRDIAAAIRRLKAEG